MKVKDLMSANDLRYCTPETKLTNATKMMKEANRGALPVVDKDQKVVGIITDRDICLSMAAKNAKVPAELSVKEILPAAKIRTVTGDETVANAMREMRKNKIGRLPVTDKDGKLKGMISINTLLSHAINKKQELGDISSKDENLAKTIKTLFDRNNAKPVKAERVKAEAE